MEMELELDVRVHAVHSCVLCKLLRTLYMYVYVGSH